MYMQLHCGGKKGKGKQQKKRKKVMSFRKHFIKKGPTASHNILEHTSISLISLEDFDLLNITGQLYQQPGDSGCWELQLNYVIYFSRFQI